MNLRLSSDTFSTTRPSLDDEDTSKAAVNQPSVPAVPSPTSSLAPIVTRKPNPDSSNPPITSPPTTSPHPTTQRTTIAPTLQPLASDPIPGPTPAPTAGGGGSFILTDAPTGGSGVLTDAPTMVSSNSPTSGTDMPTAAALTTPTVAATQFPTFGPSPLRDYIVSISMDGGTEFLFPDSYQSRALNFVLSQQLPTNSLTTEQEAKQLYALGCFYYSTFGVANVATDRFWLPNLQPGVTTLPGWLDDNGWMTDTSTVCGWHGLVCNGDNQVIAIELVDNRLSGFVPLEISLLKDSLWYFDVRQNLVANIGPEAHLFLSELTNLEYLLIGSTYFANDGIPDAMFALTKLVELDISYMLWYGDLGQNGNLWSNLQNLETISMGGNEYNSTFPDELVTLPKLKFLYAEFTNVQGSLDFVSRMPNIEQLWVDLNTMTGSIPTSIGTAQTLKSLSFTKSNIEGPIPTEFGNMGSLEELWMSHNKLTGQIPVEFSNISTLKRLHLQGNDLTGEMPQEVCSIVFPFGRITSLQADCENGDAVSCSFTCCTCCGPSCSDV